MKTKIDTEEYEKILSFASWILLIVIHKDLAMNQFSSISAQYQKINLF